MDVLYLHTPCTNRDEVNAYFDGALAAIKLYAVWKDGEQLVGMGRPLQEALDDIARRRADALKQMQS